MPQTDSFRRRCQKVTEPESKAWIAEIAQSYGVHPQLVGQWKKEILDSARALFEGKRGPKPAEDKGDEDRLYGEIGRLKMEVDWL